MVVAGNDDDDDDDPTPTITKTITIYGSVLSTTTTITVISLLIYKPRGTCFQPSASLVVAVPVV